MKDGKDVNVLKVLKKDAKLRQTHGIADADDGVLSQCWI